MKSRPTKRILGAALAAALAFGLGACGGGGDDAAPPSFSRLVAFGDSLSDVGSYRVSTIATLGGGQFTVNGAAPTNWTERLAQGLGLERPCAAQTGLESQLPLIPPAAVADHAGCWSYAQGGARVTDPIGLYNRALLAQGDLRGALGALTRPVAEQLARHLNVRGGGFDGTELVTVWAGANDLFMHLEGLPDAIQAGATPEEAAQAAVASMATAGTELAGYVNGSLLAKGAGHVVVVTLSDVSLTPLAQSEDEATRALILQMAQAFNAALTGGLAGADERLLLVDVFARSQEQYADRARLGNFGEPACDLAGMVRQGLLPTSLLCTGSTLVAGDVSRHFYADTVHPTPYGHGLIADFVLEKIRARGWR